MNQKTAFLLIFSLLPLFTFAQTESKEYSYVHRLKPSRYQVVFSIKSSKIPETDLIQRKSRLAFEGEKLPRSVTRPTFFISRKFSLQKDDSLFISIIDKSNHRLPCEWLGKLHIKYNPGGFLSPKAVYIALDKQKEIVLTYSLIKDLIAAAGDTKWSAGSLNINFDLLTIIDSSGDSLMVEELDKFPYLTISY